MKQNELREIFNFALEHKKKYVGVAIETRGMEQPEYIINPYTNIAQKLVYYVGAYNDDMILKSYDGIRITRAAAADTLEELMELLEDKE